MARKKSGSLAWRITKGAVKGVARGSLSVGRYLARRMREDAEIRKLQKNPMYKAQPQITDFELMEHIAGDYAFAEKKLYYDSMIILVFGKRGSGKSALGFRVLENIHGKTKRRCYVLGISQSLMPRWILPISNIEEVPNNGVVLVDEGAISFGSRESMSSKNKDLSKLLAIARHKNLTLLFITQNTGMIDKNILKLADMLLIKEGSLLQLEMERPEMRKFYEKATSSFSRLEGDKRRYVYLIDSDFEGVISHALPSFWSESLSKNQAT